MPKLDIRRFAVVVALAPLGFTAAALAHHGWSWAKGEQMELRGTIDAISMSPPHPTLLVRDSEGTVWQVDLGNPSQTARSGFTGDTAEVGDSIVVTGNRALDPQEIHMKAVRITIDGVNYDMYPERLQDD
jgi:hypothetical protein